MDLAAGRKVEKYVVERLLGRGGMASVWRVRHPELGVAYALKVVEVPGRSARLRLEQEGRTQGTLRHQNVVNVIDVIEIDGNPGLVLELVEGPTLEELLRTHRPTPGQVDELARGIIKGVRAAHRAGLVHRDLKPGNVLLATTDDGFVPKVADFGLAKVVRGEGGGLSRTRTGVMMGTPAYMAPEQFRDAKNVDHRADIWSLGVMLYELCTGRLPYEGTDLIELIDVVRAQKYPSVEELRPDLPDRMAKAIRGAMVVTAADRFQTLDELYAAWCGSEALVVSGSNWEQRLLTSFVAPSESGAPPTIDPAVRRPEEEQHGGSPARWVLWSGLGLGMTVALATVALGAVGLAAGLVVWLWPDPAPPTPSVEPRPAEVEPPPEAAPAPPPAPAPAPAPAPSDDPIPPRPRPGSSPRPAPLPTPAEPPARPAPTQAPPGRIVVTGDASSVEISGGGRAWAVGAPLPPGSYTVTARFSSGTTTKEVQVSEGQTVALRCVSTFANSCL